MDAAGWSVIIQWYEHIDVFLLVFVRLLAFFLLLPVVSGMNIPTTIKILLALGVSFVVFTSGVVSMVTYTNTLWGYFYLVLIEFLTGFVMGYMVYSVFSLIYFTGQLIDYQIGLSMMSVLDPMTQTQVPIVGNLYYLIISVFLAITGGLQTFIGAFYHSFRVVPLGTASLLDNGALAWYVLNILTEFITMGVQISLPIVGSILIIDVALGLMVKAVPQMNVFVVGMPIKLLIGLFLLLTVMLPSTVMVYQHVYETAYNALINAIWGMSP